MCCTIHHEVGEICWICKFRVKKKRLSDLSLLDWNGSEGMVGQCELD